MIPLTAAEGRVLGCLAEKQLATPQHYPLTESALIAACNQTTNRDPIVSYDQSDVRPALIGLREHGLVKRVRREGERTEKHAHRLDDTLGLATGPLAVLTVLLLRGAQTPGELRSRTARLHAFPGHDELDEAIADLADRSLVEQLPRRKGEKQARWRHLLVDDDAETGDTPAAEPAPDQQASVEALPTVRALAAEVARLHQRVTALERELGVEVVGE